jgi:DNA repair protein RadC
MPATKIQELPPQDRPRERLQRLGTAALTDAELIAILLRTGARGYSAIDLARLLVNHFGSLSGISRATVTELSRVHGMGLAKSSQLAAAFGLGQRLAAETLTRTKIDSPDIVFALLGSEMRSFSKEVLRAVLLDTRHCLIKIEDISLGSLNESIAHPREIFRPAVLNSAYALILVHNHPSGDPTPSEADHRLTRRLEEASRLLQINLIDHIIIGAPRDGQSPYFSFKEAGIL